MTDILDDSYESDLTEEEHESLILMSEHAIAKPPSLKEQSLALIDKIQSNKECWQTDDLDVVRRALESPPSSQTH